MPGVDYKFSLMHDGVDLFLKTGKDHKGTTLLIFKHGLLHLIYGIPNCDIYTVMQKDLGFELDGLTQLQMHKSANVFFR